MNFDCFEILLTGTVTLKSLLLLLAVPEELNRDLNSKKNIDSILSKYPEYKNNIDVNDMLNFIYVDNFKEDTYLNQNNITYLYELKLLKDTISAFYFKSLEELKGNHNLVCDVHSKIGRYGLQLMRLRKIIEPDFNISINPHKQTKINYLVIKGFWLNDSGKKERMFTKSLGRLDEFPGGRTGKKSLDEGKIKIQEVMFNKYKELYT